MAAPGVEADPIVTEVVGNRLHTVCREMLVALIRAAFSPNVKERYDCGTGIFTVDGDQVALAAYPPLHMGSMRGVARLLLAEIGLDKIRPGDVFITNDPFVGVSTHLPDVILVAPAFHGDELVGFVASIAHHSDIGGRVPGGQAPDSRSVFEEGLRIPLVRIATATGWNTDMVKVFRTNVRNPDERMADLKAQSAANFVGMRGLQELCSRYGAGTVGAAAAAWVDATETSIRRRLEALGERTARYEALVEDDLSPERAQFAVVLRTSRGSLQADFTGTSRAFQGSKNIPITATIATLWMVLKSMLDPTAPATEGAFRAIEVLAPEGSIVNPQPPSAVGERALSCQVLADVLMGAFSQLVPERALAECGPHHGINVSGINPLTGRFFANHESFAGGMGSRAIKDGISACRVHVAGSANLPVEPLEAELPLLIVRNELRPDSGGPGRWRGGLGLRRDIRILADQVAVTLRSERQEVPALGRDGGLAGATGAFVLNPGAPDEQRLPSFVSNRRFVKGDVISVRTPGGGGIGVPGERDPALVEEDVRFGYVSEHVAREVYGRVPAHDRAAFHDHRRTDRHA
jgi:N-methylhydantoinase B